MEPISPRITVPSVLLFNLFFFVELTLVTILSCPAFEAEAAVSSIVVVTGASILAGIFQTFVYICGLDANFLRDPASKIRSYDFLPPHCFNHLSSYFVYLQLL